MAPGRKNLRLKRRNDEDFCGRRSSLQVNLSFVSSLSDSGNGSLKSQLDNNEVTAPKRICQNGSDATLNIPENFGIRVEDRALSIIRSKEQELSKNCQILKDAIMHKTREIFDQRTELAVKTTNVLKGQRLVLKEINDCSRSINLLKRSVSSKNDSTQTSPSLKTTLVTKNSKSKIKNISPSVARISKGDASVILSGSNKSQCEVLSKVNEKVLRVRLTRIADPRLEVSLASSQSSHSSIPEDIGAPLTCSSFISGHGNRRSLASQRAESEDRECSDNPNVEESAVPTMQTLTPAEITAVQVPVSSSKKNTRLKRVFSNAASCLETTTEQSSLRAVPMELTAVQSHIPLGDSASLNTVRTSLNVNTSANESSVRSEKRISEEALPACGNSASHLSLRVNTSLGTEERSPVQKNVNNNDKKTRVSMIKSMEKVAEDSIGNNTDPLENMSLLARLRNISGKKATETDDRRKSNGTSRSSLGEGPSFVEGTPYPPSRSILWRTQLKSATLNTIRNRTARKVAAPVVAMKKSSRSSDSDSSMGTEYLTPPNTTGVLGDSPCRFTPASDNTQIIPDSSDEDEPTEVATTGVQVSEKPSKELTKELLKDLPKAVPESLPIEILTKLPNDLPLEISKEPTKDLSKENATVDTSRPAKKKLLPLYENLELVSFSPVSPALPSPKKPIVRRKRIQKRKAARAVAAKRIESTREEDEDDPLPECSHINRILTGKEKEKTRKPRKIISKKIVVKKIVGMDVLREWEGLRRGGSDRDSTTGRNSLNDFSKKKTLPISGRNTKSQKLIIVATGFSKGDMDLVKSIVKELGGAELCSTVTRRTTHVVSTGVRTINLLRGIIRGCWLVSFEWVLKSLEQRNWLNAEHYEMVHFSKAVQENRRDRQLFGKAYVPELFTTCGPIYIEHRTTPPPDILKELVKTAGGRISENIKDSKLSVGPDGLREIWILDSITTGDLQPIEDYQRK